jgi:hypothetical protein
MYSIYVPFMSLFILLIRVKQRVLYKIFFYILIIVKEAKLIVALELSITKLT